MGQSTLFDRKNYFGVCGLSIFSTIIFHYTAYFCIIFRAIRIFQVMNLEKKYLDKIYKLAGEQTESSGLEEKQKMVYFPLLQGLGKSSTKKAKEGGEERKTLSIEQFEE